MARFYLAVAEAGARVRERELVAGAGEGDVEEAAFFFDAAGRNNGLGVRDDTVIAAGEVDQRKLETFTGVDGHEENFAFLKFLVVIVVEERDEPEIIGEGCLRRALFVGGDAFDKGVDISEAVRDVLMRARRGFQFLTIIEGVPKVTGEGGGGVGIEALTKGFEEGVEGGAGAGGGWLD